MGDRRLCGTGRDQRILDRSSVYKQLRALDGLSSLRIKHILAQLAHHSSLLREILGVPSSAPRGLEATSITCNAALSACGKREEWSTAVELFARAQRQGLGISAPNGDAARHGGEAFSPSRRWWFGIRRYGSMGTKPCRKIRKKALARVSFLR